MATTPGLVYLLHAMSPVHMGVGISTGGIDLPLAREAGSGWPCVPGSSLKGVLRDGRGGPDDVWLFGPAWGTPDDRDQGALMFSDARMLCLPVRSYSGGWAWVSCRSGLAAYRREALYCRVPNLPPTLQAAPDNDHILLADQKSPLTVGNKVFLHDIHLVLSAEDAAIGQWANHLGHALFAPSAGSTPDPEAMAFRARFALVSDEVFGHLSRVGMDVRTRNRLEKNKRVADTGPWVEESLPVESVLWGSVTADSLRKQGADKPAQAAIDALKTQRPSGSRLQLGGKATVGRGAMRWLLIA